MSEKTELGAIVEIWKATIDVQKHFNDIEMKIRSIAVGGLGALLGAAALSYREGLTASIGSIVIPISVYVLVAALVFWLALYFMDRFWYHRLLMGSIYHGQAIEEKYEDVLPELSLTKSIGKESPFDLFGKTFHSKDKMDSFYGVGGALIVLFALLLIVTTPTPMTEEAKNKETQEFSTTQVQQPDETSISASDAPDIELPIQAPESQDEPEDAEAANSDQLPEQ